MVELALYETLSTILAGLGITLASIYYILNLRSQKINRKMMLYLPVYTKFQDKEFMRDLTDIRRNWEWEDPDDFYEKYGSKNAEARGQWHSVVNYFHCVGSLIKRDELDVDLVSDLMQSTSVLFWEEIEPIVKDARTFRAFPRYLHSFEYLYDVMKKREQLESK
jgi:hypothetical protein